ncbi:VOC family protein [Vibrio sonorensis]|uniref:VOC family protein n=1 Tax=Vibrio sonorensis TaxID=1004316 RepID=UPI0008DAE3BF|nr:VOC family protein [Vibrio sonorensis]
MTQYNPVGWFEIYVDDMERAKGFYEQVFQKPLEAIDMPANFNMQMWAFPSDMEKYGAAGALVKMDNVPAGGNSTLVYFTCQDCAVEESRVADAGGTVQVPKMSIGPHGFISVALDTEGNTIGFHSNQ